MNNRFLKLATLAATVLLMPTLSGCAGWTIVGPGDRGIVQSFGDVKPTLLQPGSHFYNPFVEQIEMRSIRQTTYSSTDPDSGLTTNPLTSDQQPVTMNYSVMVRVPESQLVNLYKNYRGDVFTTLVAPKINESVRQVVSEYKAEEITRKATEISTKVVALSRAKIGDLVEVVDVPITHFQMPPAIQEAINAKQKMQISALTKQAEYEKELRQAQIAVARAKADADSIKLKQEALKQAPELIEFEKVKVELVKAGRWNGQLPTTIIGGNGVVPYFNVNAATGK